MHFWLLLTNDSFSVGNYLEICAAGDQTWTCCTQDVERQLGNQSSLDFRRVLQDKLIGLTHIFQSKTASFDSKCNKIRILNACLQWYYGFESCRVPPF